MTNNDFKDTINDLILQADYKKVDPTMTTNEKNINVEPEKEVEATIQEALNASQEDQVISASLGGFKLVNNGSKYLQVKHASLAEATIGIISQSEYETSKDKVALLKSIVKDAFPQTKIAFEGEFKEPKIEKTAWKGPLQSEYSSFEEFKGYSDNYGLAERLGFASAEEAWEANPVVEGSVNPEDYKVAEKEVCPLCKGQAQKEDWVYCPKCKPMPEQQPKKSWLGDLDDEQSLPEIPTDYPVQPLRPGQEAGDKVTCNTCGRSWDDAVVTEMTPAPSARCPFEAFHENEMEASLKTIAIKEDGSNKTLMTDHLAQSLQLEDQKVASANEKIKTEAVNALVSMLQGMGHGSSKIAEVTESPTGYDVIATIDSDGALRAVSIPVTVKEGKVVLPKKTLVSELVAKGIDLNARLSEEFGKTVLARIEAEEARVQFEQEEANQIIAEKVTKTAGDEPKTQFEGTNEQVVLNKHLIPSDVSELEIGDTVHLDGISYKLVSKTKDVLSKGEDDGSQWTFEKVTPISK